MLLNNGKKFCISEIVSIFALNKQAMRIISFSAIREYVKKHSDADIPLRD